MGDHSSWGYTTVLGALPMSLPTWAPQGLFPSTEHFPEPNKATATISREYSAPTEGI